MHSPYTSAIVTGRITAFRSKPNDGTPGIVRRFAASTIGTFDLTDKKQLAEFSKIRPKKSSDEKIKTVACPHKVHQEFYIVPMSPFIDFFYPGLQ